MKKRRKPDVFGEWISVEVLLPQKDVAVLVVDGEGVMRVDARQKPMFDEWFWINSTFHAPTHWTPLPKPPKKGRR